MPVSDEPKPSVSSAFGAISRRRSRSEGASGAPPLDSVYIVETSNGPCSSQASTSGRAIASPTTVMTETFSRSIVRQISTASNGPECSTTFAPQNSHIIDTHCAAACISGASA